MPSRVYRFRDLKTAGVPFTRKHVNTLENRGEFPEHIHLTPFSIGWVADEVDRWVEDKIRRRNIGQPSQPKTSRGEHRATR